MSLQNATSKLRPPVRPPAHRRASTVDGQIAVKRGSRTPRSDSCGCASCFEPAAPASARPTHAVGVEAPLKEANLRQLRRIEGQVRGIAAMIEDDRYCADVITQVSAVRESLLTVARNLMRNYLKHCASAAIQKDERTRDGMIDELLDLVGKLSR